MNERYIFTVPEDIKRTEAWLVEKNGKEVSTDPTGDIIYWGDGTSSSIELNNIRKEWLIPIEEPKPKTYPSGHFMPIEGGDIFYIDTFGKIDTYKKWDNYHMVPMHSFETKEQAEKSLRQRKAYHELVTIIHELNDEWIPNWRNHQQYKWSFENNHKDHIRTEYNNWCQSLQNELYFKSEETGKQIINQLGEEKIKLALWGIE